MKKIILLFSFVFMSSCVTSGVKTRVVASDDECFVWSGDITYRSCIGACVEEQGRKNFNKCNETCKELPRGHCLTFKKDSNYVFCINKCAEKELDENRGKFINQCNNICYKDCMIDCEANGGSTRGCHEVCE